MPPDYAERSDCRQVRQRGTPVPTNDLWIAALVMEYGASLCTRDAHFGHLWRSWIWFNMAEYNASNAECLVFAFKEGLLAKAAHDLEIRVEHFEIRVDDASHAIVASFDPSSLRLVNAYPAGRTEPEQLSQSDVQKIHDHIVGDILQSREFPEVRFVSSTVEATGEGFRVTGALTLHGETRELHADVQEQAERWVTEVPLDQPDFGIKPFRALLGTIRIKRGVHVRVSVPRDGARS